MVAQENSQWFFNKEMVHSSFYRNKLYTHNHMCWLEKFGY